jgi:hypothetical protein
VPSASPRIARLAVLAIGAALLLAGAAAGCSTTQEKAAQHQAESRRILEAREKRQSKRHADGTKASKSQTDSAHRPQEGEQ